VIIDFWEPNAWIIDAAINMKNFIITQSSGGDTLKPLNNNSGAFYPQSIHYQVEILSLMQFINSYSHLLFK